MENSEGLIRKREHGDSRHPMIPLNSQVFLFGFGVTAWFSIAAVIPTTTDICFSLFYSLSLSSALSVPFHCKRKRGQIRGTPEGNFGFLRGLCLWGGRSLNWVFYGFCEEGERPVLVTHTHARVVVLPWLGIEIHNWGILLLEVGPTIWNQRGSIKSGGEAMSVLIFALHPLLFWLLVLITTQNWVLLMVSVDCVCLISIQSQFELVMAFVCLYIDDFVVLKKLIFLTFLFLSMCFFFLVVEFRLLLWV